MYFDEPKEPTGVQALPGARLLMGLNGLSIIALGLLPGALLAACEQAIQFSFLQ